MPTKETKNNLLEKQLSHILKGLHEAKRKGALSFTSSFECIEMLNDGIKALENTQFASVDDFDSVKELLELEQFFSVRLRLRDFSFPEYQSCISPTLLFYAGIEVQLDTLEMKAYDLDYRGHHCAAIEAKGLVFNLHNLNRWYFSEGKIDYVDYKTRALQAINESRPILEQHRGYKQILGNLVLFIFIYFNSRNSFSYS
ncbi:hypothetical protein [Rickettsiella massiliensis]|uniref:hypothetical protein n=1 Tax=Rickettsiella massiliensis TaxID=676517 RepID=UPI00029B15F4|nr:hypothetical protein [Rickettsiella massiliensis]